MSTDSLTKAALEQLRAYITTRDETGWYYGNKVHFERRHQMLIEWIENEMQKRAKSAPRPRSK